MFCLHMKSNINLLLLPVYHSSPDVLFMYMSDVIVNLISRGWGEVDNLLTPVERRNIDGLGDWN